MNELSSSPVETEPFCSVKISEFCWEVDILLSVSTWILLDSKLATNWNLRNCDLHMHGYSTLQFDPPNKTLCEDSTK